MAQNALTQFTRLRYALSNLPVLVTNQTPIFDYNSLSAYN